MKNKILMLVLALFVAICGIKVNAQAADYKVYNLYDAEQMGGSTFSYEYFDEQGVIYRTTNGVKEVFLEGKGLSSIILSDGTHIYCQISLNNTANVYFGTVSGKVDFLFEQSIQEYFTLVGCRKGKIYFIDGIDPGYLYSRDLSTGTVKLIDKNTTETTFYKNYIVMTPYCGAFGPNKLKVYNISTGKKKTISKKMLGYNVSAGKLYYVECIKMDYGDGTAKAIVKSCKLNGTKNKKITKTFRLKYPTEIKNKYIKYIDVNDKEIKKNYK